MQQAQSGECLLNVQADDRTNRNAVTARRADVTAPAAFVDSRRDVFAVDIPEGIDGCESLKVWTFRPYRSRGFHACLILCWGARVNGLAGWLACLSCRPAPAFLAGEGLALN